MNIYFDNAATTNLDIEGSQGEFAIGLEYRPGRTHSILADTIAKNANVFRVLISAPIGWNSQYPTMANDKTAAGINDINNTKYGTLDRFAHCMFSNSCGYQIIGVSALIAPQFSSVCDTVYDTVAINCTNQYGYNWNDSLYTHTGNYSFLDTFGNSGCDTVNRLLLTFTKNTFDTLVEQACSFYVTPSNDTLYASGSYSDTVANSYGCDSVIQINLTIISGSSLKISSNLIVCDSIFISRIGNIDSSGTYLDTVLSSVSCDTVFEYFVVVNSTKFDTIQPFACDSFISPSGKIKYSSSIFSDTIPTDKNCDSIIYIDLTVSNTTYRSFNGSACISHTLPSGRIIDTSGVYVDTIMNARGCDSIITFNMTIREIDTSFGLFPSAIQSNETGGTYRWFNCDSGFTEVFGFSQFSRTLNPPVKGNYAIEVTKNGCKDTTRCGYVRNCDLRIIKRYNLDGSTSFYFQTSDPTPVASVLWKVNKGFSDFYATTDTFTRFLEDYNYYNTTVTVTYNDGTVCDKLIGIVNVDHPNGCSFTTDTIGADTSGNVIVKRYINKVSQYDKVYNWIIKDSIDLGTAIKIYYNTDTIIDTLDINSGTIEMRRANPLSNNYCSSIIGFTRPNKVVFCKSKFTIVQVAPFQLTVIDSSFGSFNTDKQWYYGDGNSDSSVNFPSHLYNSVGDYELCLFLYDYDTVRNYMACFSVYCDSIKIDNSGMLNRSSSNPFTINVVPYSSYYNKTPIPVSACNSYTLSRNGAVVTSSGMYPDTLINSFGTDSVVIMDVTIFPEKQITQVVNSCGSYVSPTNKVYSSSGTYKDTLVSTEGCDSIITTQLTIPKDSIVVPIIVCDSLVLSNGIVVKVSGDFRDTLTNSIGCDSVVIYQVTKSLNSPITVLNLIECETYIAPNGSVYNASGTYYNTLVNSSGCDSVLEINLQINQKTFANSSISGCDSVMLPSQKWVYSSGMYSDTLTNSAGCDSVILITATIGMSNFSTTTITGCDSVISSQGQKITMTGTYYDTIVNSFGCYDIFETVAVVNNSAKTSSSITTCDFFTSPSGKIFNTSGIYFDTLITAAGCDSLFQISLTVLSSSYSTISVNGCYSYLSPSGKTYYTSNTYVDTIVNAVGCDSIITINLTMNSNSNFSGSRYFCNSFVAPSGKIFKTAGFHNDTIPNSMGCDSIISFNLAKLLNGGVTVSGITLTAMESNANYQWLDCDNGNVSLSGETGKSFIATLNGNYAVEITKNNCTDTSACYTVNQVGINPLNNSLSGMELYPNPSSGDFVIVFPVVVENVKVSIYSINGKLMENKSFTNNSIDISYLEKGIYMIQVIEKNHKKTIKFIKE